MTHEDTTLVREDELDSSASVYRLQCPVGDDETNVFSCGYTDAIWEETPIDETDILCPDCHNRMRPVEGAVIDGTDHYLFYDPDRDAFHESLTPELRQTIESGDTPEEAWESDHCHLDECPVPLKRDRVAIVINSSHLFCSPTCAKEGLRDLNDEEVTEVRLHDPGSNIDWDIARQRQIAVTDDWHAVSGREEADAVINDFGEIYVGPFGILPEDEKGIPDQYL